MPFAGKLGTIHSRPGNIRLAALESIFAELLVCDAYVPSRGRPLLWMQWQCDTVLLPSLFESAYPPCEGPRGRPDEQATQRTRPGSDDSLRTRPSLDLSYRTRPAADDSLRTRPAADDDRRTRPPECGNES